MTILTIDFEASCLPRHGRSYPIEVGVAGPDGARSWLIRPSAAWAGWDWTAEAEGLHGLTREKIAREGRPADVVLRELADMVGDLRVVSDSVLDQYWLETLAAAAGSPAPFRIDHVSRLFDEWRASEGGIAEAVECATILYPARHRAVYDAQWLQALVAHVGGVAAAIARPARPAVAQASG